MSSSVSCSEIHAREWSKVSQREVIALNRTSAREALLHQVVDRLPFPILHLESDDDH